ncbi:MAG: FtsX-like permease family protein [Ruminococcaceae bacterium]|nr:FtsX-like permease family protein [Oscillospiraceae bacterium]
MFIRNGVQSNLRARGRTALFAGLILFLALVMILSLGVYLYCGSTLTACEGAYRSIALVEYLGAEYPNGDEPDNYARAAASAIDDDAVKAVGGVKAWYRDSHTLSAVEGYRRIGIDMPYRDYAIVQVSHISPIPEKELRLRPGADTDDPFFDPYDMRNYEEVETGRVLYYTGITDQTIYAYEEKNGVVINILPGDLPLELEKNGRYVIHGCFVNGDEQGIGNGMRTLEVSAFSGSGEQPWAVYSAEKEIPRVFCDYAERYRIINNYVHTVTCGDVGDVWEFHQGLVYLQSGRLPKGSGECVVSGDIAESMGLAVGDTIRVTSFASSESSRYDIALTDREEVLTVAGRTNTYEGCLGYIWRQGPAEDAPLFGYQLGVISLENAAAGDAIVALEQHMPENVRLTLLDQGYADAVEPFQTMQSTASHVLLISAVGTMAVLVLFAFLFVGRQNETVRILVSLGTPQRKIALWLLSGALVISGGAAVLGGVLGSLGLPTVFRTIQARAESSSGQRLRYSEMLLSAVKQVDLTVKPPLWPILLTVVAIILLAMVLCAVFLAMAYRGGTLRRGKSRVRVPHGRTSLVGRGSLRFALLSIRRGGPRSVVVPAVSCVLTAMILLLSGVYQTWETERDHVLRDTTLEGQVTSTNGRYFSGLVVSVSTARQLLALEDVSEMHVSVRQPYWLDEEMPAFGDGSFAQERREDWILHQPDIVSVNGLKGAKEFYFTDPFITWLDGWNESCLSDENYPSMLAVFSGVQQQPEFYPAVMGDTFLAEHDLALGGALHCTTICKLPQGSAVLPVTLRIVGSYRQMGSRAHIYVPLAASFPTDLLYTKEAIPGDARAFLWSMGPSEENYRAYQADSATFSTCRFTLSSAVHLEATRDALSRAGFGWPGHIGASRTALVLRDASFIKTTENLNRSISMGRVMLSMIFLVVTLLGFIISWLMVNGRKREFALMRGLGVGRGRLFFSFFWEQALLCLAGCLLGCVALVWCFAGGTLQWVAPAAYLLCYLIGCAVSVRLISHVNLIALLTDKE